MARFFKFAKGERVLILVGGRRQKWGFRISIQPTPALQKVFEHLPWAEMISTLPDSLEKSELENTLRKVESLQNFDHFVRASASAKKSVVVTEQELEVVNSVAALNLSNDSCREYLRKRGIPKAKRSDIVELIATFRVFEGNGWSHCWDLMSDARVKGMFDLVSPQLESALRALVPEHPSFEKVA